MRADLSSLDASLEAFAAATTAGERSDAFVGLVRGLRAAEEGAAGSKAILPLLESLEGPGARREAFSRALATFLSETDATNLFGDTGIPSDRGFLAEAGDRLSARLVPAPRNDRDLSRAVRRLFRTETEVRRFQDRPLDIFHRIAGVFSGAVPAETWEPVRRAFADGFRLLATRVEAQGLSRKLRARATPGPVSDSPFFRIRQSADALLAAWLSAGDVEAAAKAFRRDSGDCRKETKVIQQHLETQGVSVDIVFGLEVIDRCLTRMALMADILEAPEGVERTRALYRLFSRLALFAQQDRSLGHLVRWNLRLLDRKIVDRSGETGEHYIAETRSEYRHIWVAAAGGGALTVLTAAAKMAVHGWHLAPFPESFLYGLNYAVSFVALQTFGFVLATKQPAMTAAALAGIIRETKGEDREERIAVVFARLTSSQLAAAVSNVFVVALGAALFELLWKGVTGTPFLAEEEARGTFEALSPLDSGTVFYSGLTGVLLWLASVAGGWFENWATLHRIPEGLAQHPLGASLGRERMGRAAECFRQNASGWATNVALGFLLGFAPAVGRFFGIPFDVRHVTLSTGQLALAAASLGERWLFGGSFFRALAGIGVMFVLNLSVAFSLSLLNAAQAYAMPLSELGGVLRHVGRHVRKSPLDFVRPPRETGRTER